MTMPHRRRLALALATAALGWTVPARASDEPEADPGLLARLRRVESAFRQSDANSLRLSFTDAGKMRVDIKDLTDGQETYGAGQLQVIFAHIFQGFRTQDFHFGKDGVKVSNPRTAFARGRWTRRYRPDGQEAVDTLIFTLQEDDGDWRILEIRSAR